VPAPKPAPAFLHFAYGWELSSPDAGRRPVVVAVALPMPLAARVLQDAHRRGVLPAKVIEDALEEHFGRIG
jgi:hypothetical protein